MTVEIAVAMLIAWAVGKANRVGKPINGLTDEALELAVNRVRNVVVAKLGGDPAVQRLLNEARATNGAVSSATQAAAEQSVSVAVAGDSGFGAELARLTAPPTPPPAPAGSGSRYNNSGTFGGVMGDISTTGPVTVTSKIVHQAKRHPVLAMFVVVGAVALLGFSADRLISGPTSGAPPVRGTEAMAGTWKASDGTGTKTFGSDGGRCDGFFYSNGEPLDIGGPMTCTISSKPDAKGLYTLIVTQGPNRAEYLVEFTDPEHATVFDSSGTELYDLEGF
ncbi:hypothetical protein ACWFPY_34945 [Nocardia fluminea]